MVNLFSVVEGKTLGYPLQNFLPTIQLALSYIPTQQESLKQLNGCAALTKGEIEASHR